MGALERLRKLEASGNADRAAIEGEVGSNNPAEQAVEGIVLAHQPKKHKGHPSSADGGEEEKPEQ